jgi:pyrroline-5-carboxylate reductase
MKTIGIIGFGNMGTAIATGLGKMKSEFTCITSEKKEERVEVARQMKIELRDNASLVRDSDLVLLAVKPQELDTLFKEIGPHSKGKTFISIIAGKKIELFKEKLQSNRIVRFMPNLAATERKALVGVSFPEGSDDELRKDVIAIASAIGEPCELPESLMPAVTGLSGSGIAYVFAFAHAMALGGVSSGIAYPKALSIAIKTIEGAAALLGKSGENPIALLCRVISPAGTTIQGVNALEKGGFTYSVIEAVERATDRAKELEG